MESYKYRRLDPDSGIKFGPWILVIFVFSGSMKWIPLPLDITLLSIACLLAITIYQLVNHEFREQVLLKSSFILYLTFVAFFVWYFFTLNYTLSIEFWPIKLQGFVLSFFALTIPIVCLRSDKDFYFINQALIFVGVVCALAIFLFFITGTLNFLIFQGYDKVESKIPDYLALGTMIGIAAIVLLDKVTKLHYLLILLCFFSLMMIGARGPFVFLILCLIIKTLLTSGHFRIPRKISLSDLGIGFMVLALLIVTFALAITFSDLDSTFTRLINIFTDEEELAETFRVEAFSKALSVIESNPIFGAGFASYGLVGYGVDSNIYPHNLLLEAWAESGLVGLFFFLLGFVLIVTYTLRYRQDRLLLLYLIILLFEWLNFMKSGGFVSSRELYLFVGVIIARIDCISRERHLLSGAAG